jgi:Fe2+ transport system protein FeoA
VIRVDAEYVPPVSADCAVPVSLDGLPPGTRCIVRRILGDPRFARRLMEMGLVPGTPVQMLRRAPLGDPIELVVRGTHISIRRREADRVHVDIV